MSGIDAPPINELLAEKETGLAKLPWILFFNSLFEGDVGETWSPSFVNLTEVGGSPTYEARYYRINQTFCFFYITLTPVTNTSAVAGTTYIDNFPLTFQHDSACWVVAGGTGTIAGHIVSATNRIYVPAWSAVTIPLTIVGIGAAR